MWPWTASACGATAGPAVELVALLLNLTLGAFDAGLLDESASSASSPAGAASIATLASDMIAGKVELLILAGVNPVYDAPVALKMADALAKVPFIVSLNDRLDETSALADRLAPASHPFECWSDAVLLATDAEGLSAATRETLAALHRAGDYPATLRP